MILVASDFWGIAGAFRNSGLIVLVASAVNTATVDLLAVLGY